MANLVLPRVQAMVLCDDIQESDQVGDAVNLVGVRAVLGMGAFPAVAPQLCVYLQMSGHQGSVECHMEVEYLAMGDVIAETETRTVYFNDPSAVVVIYFRLANCVLPSAGLYYVQAYADEKLIGERPLLLQLEE